MSIGLGDGLLKGFLMIGADPGVPTLEAVLRLSGWVLPPVRAKLTVGAGVLDAFGVLEVAMSNLALLASPGLGVGRL